MEEAKKILLLDDDTWLLREVGSALQSAGFQVLANENVSSAVQALTSKPDFAVIDLFLDGEAGSELSNSFIRDFLIPGNIPYGRLTSAPALVPPEYGGAWVLHKRFVQYDPKALITLLNRELELNTPTG